jgi:hypothetical protein
MEVLFEVSGSWFPLRERAATILAEDLRRKAAGQLGTEGTEGALAAADAIEDVLVGRFSGPIPLEGEAAEAIYYDLDVAIGTSPAGSEERVLHAALRPLHDEHGRKP